MASELTAKGQATRARIVETAAELIFRNGAAGTSIEDVRRAAKVSGSQMTHYFSDKRSLIRAVIARQADAVLASDALGTLDSFAALREWGRLNVERQRAQRCEGGCRFGSLAAELVECDDELRADCAAGFDRWAALLGQGLQAMHERGDLRPEADPDALALALLTAAQGGALLTQAHRDTRALEAVLDAVLAHIESFAASTV